MTLFVNPFRIGTQVETVTDNAKVQCEITSIPSCSTPLCSPVKSVLRPDEDDKKDEDHFPPINLFPDEDRQKETNLIEESTESSLICSFIFAGSEFYLKLSQCYFFIGFPAAKKNRKLRKVKVTLWSFFPA